jgi:hypothetical protein
MGKGKKKKKMMMTTTTMVLASIIMTFLHIRHDSTRHLNTVRAKTI